MLSKDIILSFLKSQKEELFCEYQLVRIGLCGSFARDEATEKSDIDLIIEFEPDTKNLFEKKLKLKAFIGKALGREIDLGREKYLKPYFKSQILQHIIYV